MNQPRLSSWSRPPGSARPDPRVLRHLAPAGAQLPVVFRPVAKRMHFEMLRALHASPFAANRAKFPL